MWADIFLHHSRFTEGAPASFKVEFDNPIQGLCFWVVSKVHYLDCWYIPCWSQVVGPWMQLERPGCANKEHNRAFEQLQTHSDSPSHNHSSRGVSRVWKGHWRGNWGRQRGKYSLLACTHVVWFEAVASCGPKCGRLHWGRLQSSPLFFLTRIVWLINLLEFWGSKGNSRRNAKACREHEDPSWPTRQAQTSPKVGLVASDYRWIS